MKMRWKDPVQTTVGMLPEEDSPCIVRLDTLATVIFLSRTWSPGKNTIVVLEAKYSSASCAYSESVVQLAELWGQDEHEVAVGVTQYTFSAEQYESSNATRTRLSVNWAIMCLNDCRKISSKVCVLRVKTLWYGFFPLDNENGNWNGKLMHKIKMWM